MYYKVIHIGVVWGKHVSHLMIAIDVVSNTSIATSTLIEQPLFCDTCMGIVLEEIYAVCNNCSHS